MNIKKILFQKIYQVLISINIESCISSINIQKTTHKKFGHYQINGLITVSKKTNIPIHILIEKILKIFDLKYIAQNIEIKQPGFINIFLHPQWISKQINYIFSDLQLGISMKSNYQTIVVDYSSPNIAKEMHVGHLRSTIIGDSMVRILHFLGHNVIQANHIGDWGTQFGMLIAYIENTVTFNYLFQKNTSISTLEKFYQKAKEKYDNDPKFASLSRKCIVQLQQGNQNYQKIWKKLVNISIINNQKIYSRLHVTLKTNHIMGESAYHHLLPDIIKDLKNKRLAVTSQGATLIFIKNKNNQKNSPFGVIIQKKDGAYLYSSTDIACIKYRCEKLKADRIIYYTDSRQKQHLEQIWEIAKKSGYIKKTVLFEHHMCGMLLKKNGKPFQTRSGNTLKLTTLLDEGLKRAYHIISKKNSNLTHIQINKLAYIISIGSIKYSELSKNRTTNYVFNWDNMLNFEGNTAPYIQYAYTRIVSLTKHAKCSTKKLKKQNIQLNNEKEILLAICLLQFEETLISIETKGTPHILCSYLYKLSTLFSSFYENYPILTIQDTHIKYSRLKLAVLTARILKKGLNLLGIKTIEYM